MTLPKDINKRDEYIRKNRERNSGKNNPNYGKPRSEETKRKIGNAQKGENHHQYGKPRPPETRQKISDSNKGKPAWNKGIPVPDHIKKKISEGCKNPSKETRDKLSKASKGKTPWIKGKHHTQETKAKIGDKQRGEKSAWWKKHHSEVSRNKMSLSRSGSKSPKWKGGISFGQYCYRFSPRRKRAVRAFFNHTCICCGTHRSENITKTGRCMELSVHHIDYDKEQGCNGKPFNLVPLCLSCHAKEKLKELEYRKYINKTLNKGYEWGIWSRNQYEIEIMYSE